MEKIEKKINIKLQEKPKYLPGSFIATQVIFFAEHVYKTIEKFFNTDYMIFFLPYIFQKQQWILRNSSTQLLSVPITQLINSNYFNCKILINCQVKT